MYYTKIFLEVNAVRLESNINEFMASDKFKGCVVISTEFKKIDGSYYFILTYFDRQTESRLQH